MFHIPPKRILVATDFSDIADHAIDYALAIARPLEAEVVIVHVWEAPFWAYPENAPLDMSIDLEKSSRAALDAVLKPYAATRIAVRGVLRCGPPWLEIVETAQSEKADLVVIGTHGRRGVERFYMGSVAERVLRTSPCPVLTIGAKPKA